MVGMRVSSDERKYSVIGDNDGCFRHFFSISKAIAKLVFLSSTDWPPLCAQDGSTLVLR